MQDERMRIGVDLGGTKIEAIALEGSREVARRRVPTPRGDYEATISTVSTLVSELGAGTVGGGIPGALSRVSGLVKNANSPWLIGRQRAGNPDAHRTCAKLADERGDGGNR